MSVNFPAQAVAMPLPFVPASVLLQQEVVHETVYLHIPAALLFTLLSALLVGLALHGAGRRRYISKEQFFLGKLNSALLVLLTFFAAPWAFTSVYLRWVFLLLGTVLLVWSMPRRHIRNVLPHPAVRWLRLAGRVAVSCLVVWLTFLFFKGTTYEGEPVELQFPLRQGTYYIMQGGGSRLTNPMHGNYSWQRFGYALDIARLNRWGNRANNPFSSEPQDYVVYGDTIFSPCDGRVVLLHMGQEDNLVGTLNRTKGQIHGNHIVIQGNGFRIFMAHLKDGTGMVKEGDAVKAGQPLALLGNAGFTVEPHLHLQATRGYDESDLDPIAGHSVPMVFGGRFLWLNEQITSLP